MQFDSTKFMIEDRQMILQVLESSIAFAIQTRAEAIHLMTRFNEVCMPDATDGS